MSAFLAQKEFEGAQFRTSLEYVAGKNADAYGNSRLDNYLNDQRKTSALSTKCLNGEYKFPPYALKLLLKGAGKAPREVSIPSLIDQVILKSMDRALKKACPIQNQTNLAFFIVDDLSNYLKTVPKSTLVMRIDIKSFFDKINHDLLEKKLKNKACPDWLLKLVMKAVRTPAQEKGVRVAKKRKEGVPQGISIASYLSDLYLEDFDKGLEERCLKFSRYVDDIIILFNEDQEKELISYLDDEFKKIGLEYYNTEEDHKYFKGTLADEVGFDFLGYHFFAQNDDLRISIRNSSVQKYINSLIGLITKYRRGGYRLTNEDQRVAEEIFVYDLNERITGAFTDERKYGWLWYFRQMNDLALLDKMDKIIRQELAKYPETRKIKPKRLKRTYYEISKFDPRKRYILNYSLNDTEFIKRYFSFLDKRIRDAATPQNIRLAFNRFTNLRLKRLMLDELSTS